MASGIIIAAKCRPERKIFSDIKKAGLTAVELYLSKEIMRKPKTISKLCGDFDFQYAIHAPNDYYEPKALAELSASIKAGIVSFHNIYWEDEWEGIAGAFKGISTKLCIENTHSTHEPLKFMRRYGLGRCLDLEHMQMECAGIYEEVFIETIKEASHIHLTGYLYGSCLWHTHIHHSPQHSLNMLNLIRKAGYSGLVVSEARNCFQNQDEFRGLYNFIKYWKRAGF